MPVRRSIHPQVVDLLDQTFYDQAKIPKGDWSGAHICTQQDPSARLTVLSQVAEMLDQAFYDQSKFLEGGWVDGLKYEDEILDLLQVRLCIGCQSGAAAALSNACSAHVHGSRGNCPGETASLWPASSHHK